MKMPLSSTKAVSSPRFTIHLEEETSGNGCRRESRAEEDVTGSRLETANDEVLKQVL